MGVARSIYLFFGVGFVDFIFWKRIHVADLDKSCSGFIADPKNTGTKALLLLLLLADSILCYLFNHYSEPGQRIGIGKGKKDGAVSL